MGKGARRIPLAAAALVITSFSPWEKVAIELNANAL
jgi:hypothetical protein